MGSARTPRLLLSAAAVLMMTGGCAPKVSLAPQTPTSAVRIDVPFVPSRSERCAATAVEMIAAYWQSHALYRPRLTGPELDERTLLPAKGGTLQAELVAAARSDGLLVYPLAPSFDALLSELAAGHPVIVLLNRGFSWHPLWHYVPVTGYAPEPPTLSSHFAERPDEALPLRTFAALWKRSGYWGVVPLPPGELPATAEPERYLLAAYDLERSGMREEAITAYEQALQRWPEATPFRFALANAYDAAGRFAEAETAYRRLLAEEPGHLFARNNLADLLCRNGRTEEARQLLEGTETDDPRIHTVIEATRDMVEKGCRQ